MNGVLNIDKPPGMTSHDVVARVRRVTRQKRVGHAGTLDPDATGVLLVCLGFATRLSDLLADQGKSYRATLVLGASTTSEDASGEVVAEVDASCVTRNQLAGILPQFIGDIAQVPPMVSALHHEGKRLYDLARQGIIVERAARTVRIDGISLIAFAPGQRATATIDVQCGKGTYIRTLCADIGAALGVGGYMGALRRTSVGVFATGDQGLVALDNLTAETAAAQMVSPSHAVSFLPARVIIEGEVPDLFNGKDIPANGTAEPNALVRVVDAADVLLAIGRVTDDATRIHPEKVFKD